MHIFEGWQFGNISTPTMFCKLYFEAVNGNVAFTNTSPVTPLASAAHRRRVVSMGEPVNLQMAKSAARNIQRTEARAFARRPECK